MKKDELLKIKLEALASLLNTNTSSEVYSEEEREEGKHNKFYKREFLYIENYSMYGGYKIVLLGVNGSSGQYEPFGSKRRKYNDFIDFIDTLIMGIRLDNGTIKI